MYMKKSIDPKKEEFKSVSGYSQHEGIHGKMFDFFFIKSINHKKMLGINCRGREKKKTC